MKQRLKMIHTIVDLVIAGKIKAWGGRCHLIPPTGDEGSVSDGAEPSEAVFGDCLGRGVESRSRLIASLGNKLRVLSIVEALGHSHRRC